ncbi:bifunctional 2-polyprenyl-6-hydroxyphenol methylase/3-demethylubiquinol 3-O-methyltransferase UbiG [Dyadobacter sp. NIV53]|uniref:class I SAM-dependent methyltransferase n=1 Tax=Dyadobacter sp. NIV53 TaxID=2861765 RepID=UPI001C87B79F|nr:class I SAM-dependent methyltransferase [Dyadobacter sp. NIV53]
MINNRIEYQRMYEAERKLWWYQVLHRKILLQITNHFKVFNPRLKILDAACGTGGLLSFLKEKGYHNISGFDFSEHAIDFSLARDLDVSFGDLKNVNAFRPDETFDVICCNDALYFLTDTEIISALKIFRKRLNKDGIILINIHAFEAFSGTHDLAVGSSRRFTFEDFEVYLGLVNLNVKYKTYWPFLLSLPIWLVRIWQRRQIRKENLSTATPDSDVSYPGNFINSLLLRMMSLEETIFHTAPFGSSLFMVLKEK